MPLGRNSIHICPINESFFVVDFLLSFSKLILFLNHNFIYLFIWFLRGLVVACMWDLVPSPGIKPRTSALGARSLIHREVPNLSFYPTCFPSIHTVLHVHVLVFCFPFFWLGGGILITEMGSYNTHHSVSSFSHLTILGQQILMLQIFLMLA